MTQKFDVERFVDDVRRASLEGQPAVDEVLARLVSDPRRLLAGVGEPKEPGFDVLHRGDYFAPGRSEWDAETLVERPFDVEAFRANLKDANERTLTA